MTDDKTENPIIKMVEETIKTVIEKSTIRIKTVVKLIQQEIVKKEIQSAVKQVTNTVGSLMKDVIKMLVGGGKS